MLYVFGVVVLVAGIVAVALSLPDRAWNDAIVRLNARIRAERDDQGALSGSEHELTGGGGLVPAHRPSVADLPPRSWLDGVLDVVIEALRRGISSRGFPRTTLKVLGAALIAIAVLLFVAATSFGGGGGGGGQHEEDAPSRRTGHLEVASVHSVERRASTGSRVAARADG